MLPNNYQGLAAFVEHMNAKIVANEPTKGDSWKGTKIEVLVANLHDEIQEFTEAKRVGEKAEELVDIANMCMMLFNRYMELAQTGVLRTERSNQ